MCDPRVHRDCGDVPGVAAASTGSSGYTDIIKHAHTHTHTHIHTYSHTHTYPYTRMHTQNRAALGELDFDQDVHLCPRQPTPDGTFALVLVVAI